MMCGMYKYSLRVKAFVLQRNKIQNTALTMNNY